MPGTGLPSEAADERSAVESTAADETQTDPSELVGDDLAIGYPTTDEPVVECERVLLPAGEVTALVGPNGSGKSTLLKTMADQLQPEAGRILLDGDRIQSFGSKELARELGLLSQENESPGTITVEDLVYHGRYPHRGFFESVTDADQAAVDRAIDLAGVDHLRESEMTNLSGGQKQLAWIAMVLAQETDVLLLDEPTTFLDLHHQLRVLSVVRTLNREAGVTVGIVLHDIGQAARFADNLIAMQDGSLYDWGPPKEVVTEQLLADVFRVDATVDGESPTGPHIAPHSAIEE
ncbi:ABC transporter ATP-binding protein [Haloarcula onubensis]|uniref:ABC transporter ATP-binding protein n=1 Tax=Haloarcula onubensis TaxID=2950539 RepID=A0ABU2FSA3_9EURY|nr:ABC transporter ATP-binding protein [Halomicroarcula sp. S3CR25-11]MDS0283644.1 ABC transporter ATP-binding protein [Halomicroarcula sp. S3CR25-11]